MTSMVRYTLILPHRHAYLASPSWPRWAYLQEVDEVAEHQSVELGQGLHHVNGRHGVVIVTDTLLVKVHGDQGLLQLPVPQLHQRGWGLGGGDNNTEVSLHS